MAEGRRLDLSPPQVRPTVGGLWLCVPYLAAMPLAELWHTAGFPGSTTIPTAQAMRALLAWQRFGHARHRQVLRSVFEEGVARVAGRTLRPTRACVTEESGRIDPTGAPTRRRLWPEAGCALGLQQGTSCDLDCHTLPLPGDEALGHPHEGSPRSRRPTGRRAFRAHAADTRVCCSATGHPRTEAPHAALLPGVA